MSRPSPTGPLAALALLALGAIGCAGGSSDPGAGGSVYGASFPSRAEIARIESAAPPQQVFDSELRRVNEWTVESPVPRRIEARRRVERTPWGELLGDETRATGERVVPIESMHCVARELARFALERGGRPDPSLQRFLVGACNAPLADVSLQLLEGDVAASEDERQIFERWREPTRSLVRPLLESRRAVAGIGFARRAARAVVYVVWGTPVIELEPVETRLARDEPLELRGRVLEAAESVLAVINRGRLGAAPCAPAEGVRPPAFHFVCEPDAADESARVSLTFAPPNRVVGKQALTALVRRGGGPPVYRRLAYTRPHPVGDASLLAPAFLDELNAVRAQAGLRRVTLDPDQTSTATRVAPHLFAAFFGGQEDVADLAVLGLLAGWDVAGNIRMGGIAFGAVPETDDVSALLAVLLEEPVARITLLDPEIERVAVGPLRTGAGDRGALGAVVTGYSLFRPETVRADADALFARLAEERRERRKPQPERLVRVWMNAMDAAAEISRGVTPGDALDELLGASASALTRDVQGWYAETSELDEFRFPEELVNASRLGTAIGVAHRKDPDAAWGHYVVVVVSVAD